MPRERLRRNRRCFADDDALAARVEPQADSSERPFWRRAAKMARPARVRMRRRKPWVLALRRLFGWNVRLLTRFLRYCTAMRGSVLKVVRGTRSNDAVTGMQTNRLQADESGRQHRPRPTVREWAGQGQTRQARPDRSHQTRRKPPMVNRCGRPCQATRRRTRIFLRIDDEFSDPSRIGLRRRLVLTSCSPQVSAGYAQSVDNCVEGRHTMLTRRTDQSDGIRAT